MKKLLALLMIIVIILSCSACGNNDYVEVLNVRIQELESELAVANQTIQNLEEQIAASNLIIQDFQKSIEGKEESQEPSESASSLGATEAKIVEFLTNSLYDFDNPATVRVIEFHAYSESNNTYYLTLTSENIFGGNLTDIYELNEEGAFGSTFNEDDFIEKRTIFKFTTPSCDISQINHALEEHCNNQGWIIQSNAKTEPVDNDKDEPQIPSGGSTSGGGTFKTYSFD